MSLSHECRCRFSRPYWFAVLTFLWCASSWAQDPGKRDQKEADLTQVSIENLMNMEVTSVSKREQKLSRTAAAIFVITQEDIARSGARNIPDVLRMVPGMNVAQINANTWAITARGFNERFSNELQVAVDGRVVYTPTFGGVFWDVLDVPLEDIERIEVIRGPGGTIWGANAVNGVINIITKSANKTIGTQAEVGAGNLNEKFGTAQYGGSLGNKVDYRAYAKYWSQGELRDPTGANGRDSWHTLHGGFRADSRLSAKDTVSESGGIYTGREGQLLSNLSSFSAGSEPTRVLQVNLSGGFLESVWKHTYSERSETSLQVFFDRYTRNDLLGETRNTVQADFQHHFAWRARQELVWGASYRFSASNTIPNATVSLNPADQSTQLVSGYLQDEIALVPNRSYITVGSKLEHNDYTGTGVFPSVRLTWSPNERQMAWAAVSRAARIPASTDNGLRASAAVVPGPGGLPVLIAIFGSPKFKDEGLLAYEAGYRTMLHERVSLDVALFYNQYDHQATNEPGAPFLETTPAPLHLVLPLISENLMHGETHGIEVAANWKINRLWTLAPGYAFERIHMHTEATSQDRGSAADAEGSTPRHSAQIRSRMELPHGLAWNASAYFVGRIDSQDIPSYVRIDTDVDWRWSENVSLSAVGQNLQKDHHTEFIDATGSVNSSLLKRSAYLKLSYRF